MTVASSNLFFILSKIYQPWYVPEAQLVVQDQVALMGGFYKDCDVNKFFDTMTMLFSEEGASALGARFMATQPFEYKKYKEMKADENASQFNRGRAAGKWFGAVTNYKI